MAVLQDAIDEIQVLMRALPGIRDAPDEPPDQIAAYPFVVAYASTGTWDAQTPETIIGLHNIIIELHIARRDLPHAVEEAMKYSDQIPDTLYKALRDQTISAIETWNNLTYIFGELNYDMVETIGFQFTLNGVKMREILT